MANATSRRSLFAGATAVVMGAGITAGAAACVADFAEAPADAQLIAIATKASLIAVFGAAGPFSASAEEEAPAGSDLATFEDYAAMEYEAWSEDAGGDLLTLSKFLPRCAADHNIIALALAVMKRDHLQNAAVAAQAPAEDLGGLAEAFADLSDRYHGLAKTLQAAQLRVLAGMSRHMMATGEA